MIRQRPASRLFLLEGPDGSGKSTLAKRLVEDTGAHLVHLGPLPHVGSGLARLYVEAMLPAVMGFRPVVMDRCWLSEAIYGDVFRGGEDRLGPVFVRMLERIALRCDPLAILCLPAVETCVENFLRRKGDEYLETTKQLEQVHKGYDRHWATSRSRLAIPTIRYDYTGSERAVETCYRQISNAFVVGGRHLALHPTDLEGGSGYLEHDATWPTAGSLDGSYVIVGEKFAERKNQDSLMQFPFVSFSGAGCSVWLTHELEKTGLPERRFFWANADMPTDQLRDLIDLYPRICVYALGEKAKEALTKARVSARVEEMPHPQYAKRFRNSEPYGLVDHIKLMEKQR